MRCPVEITDERGTLVWYGYVAEVETRVGAITVGVSLDDMANKIAVEAPAEDIPAVVSVAGEGKLALLPDDDESGEGKKAKKKKKKAD